MFLSWMFEELDSIFFKKEVDSIHEACNEARKMQEHLKRILEKHKMLNADLEELSNKYDSCSKELDEAILTEDEKQKLDEEIKEREKEEVLKKVMKQKLEMEIEELKGKLQVMKHLGDEDDSAVQEKIKEMHNELQTKMEEMDDMENLNQTLMVKERQTNDELQEELFKVKLQVMKHLADEGDAAAQEKINEMTNELQTKMKEMDDMYQTIKVKKRQINDELQESYKELIKGWQDMPSGRRNIGLKKTGEIDMKEFIAACKEKFHKRVARIKASELKREKSIFLMKLLVLMMVLIGVIFMVIMLTKVPLLMTLP